MVLDFIRTEPEGAIANAMRMAIEFVALFRP
jgi:hypothetical protein